MKLKCYHSGCEYEWQYNGKSDYYATCPRCMKKVNIDKAIRLMKDTADEAKLRISEEE